MLHKSAVISFACFRLGVYSETIIKIVHHLHPKLVTSCNVVVQTDHIKVLKHAFFQLSKFNTYTREVQATFTQLKNNKLCMIIL